MLARSSVSVATIALVFAASNSRQREEMRMAPAAADGIISKPSNHSVDQTVDKLKSILEARGVTLFALVDHSGEAAKAGLNMRPTKLLIFGNPKAGTPVMLAAPSIAIDLPLKILVWEDDRGRVWLSYNDPAYLQRRHGDPAHRSKSCDQGHDENQRALQHRDCSAPQGPPDHDRQARHRRDQRLLEKPELAVPQHGDPREHGREQDRHPDHAGRHELQIAAFAGALEHRREAEAEHAQVHERAAERRHDLHARAHVLLHLSQPENEDDAHAAISATPA